MHEKVANVAAVAVAVAVALKGKCSCEVRIKEGEQNRKKRAQRNVIRIEFRMGERTRDLFNIYV